MILTLIAAVASVSIAQPSVAELKHDTRGRPVLSVAVNDAGPFDMVVDTGAQTSLLTDGLIAELGLKPLGDQLSVAGAVGAQQVDLFPVDRLSSPLFDRRFVAMPPLPNASTTSARGIVGMEAFSGGKLVVDRSQSELRLEASAPAAPGYHAIAGRILSSGLLSVQVKINGVAVSALVDSGAAITVADAGVLHALGWAEDDKRLLAAGQMNGAAGDGAGVRVAAIDRLSIGPVVFQQMPVFFSHSSGQVEGQDAPGLILGSDVLNRLPAYAVDFPRAELQLKLPAS